MNENVVLSSVQGHLHSMWMFGPSVTFSWAGHGGYGPVLQWIVEETPSIPGLTNPVSETLIHKPSKLLGVEPGSCSETCWWQAGE